MSNDARKPRRTAKQLRRIAFHEAGHVVASLAYRRRFHAVTIVPDGKEAEGKVVPDDKHRDGIYRKAKRLGAEGFLNLGSLVIDYAGALSAWKAGAPKRGLRATAFTDVENAEKDLAHFLDTDAYRGAEKAISVAAQMVALGLLEVWWPLVEAVAEALITQRTLTYKQVTKIRTDLLEGPQS